MTGEEELDLSKLEYNVRKLMELVEKQQNEISSLRAELAAKNEKIVQQDLDLGIAETKNKTLLTSRVIVANEDEARQSKQRLESLIREIDRCIALLQTE
ncbi:hypothetical protein SJDPG12_00195 [Porphyromonas gingivalis SJD12]|uniref:hypothetical protein n=1 Tax=Porphyromonas gingivalis TaxID=837 RepID=UPI000B501F57|nr:hypothetical protein [Porphyromonas gingivalis]MCE8177855.1 hypothetical protein [Porphyromonas gingivalis]OWR83321.1 hypothetical protein SJDPG12_00195 [Porphyromonas gingivalis SJD12]